MPLMKGKSEKAFSHNVGAEMDAGKPQKQSLAIAYAMKRRAKKMADGGLTDEQAKGMMKGAQEGGAETPVPQSAANRKAEDEANSGGEHPLDNIKREVSSMFNYASGGPVDPIKDKRLQSDAHERDMVKRIMSNEECEYDRHDSAGEPMMAEGGQITDNYESSKTGMHQDEFHDVDPQDAYTQMHEGDVKRPNGAAVSESGRSLNQHGKEEVGPLGHSNKKEDEPMYAMGGYAYGGKPALTKSGYETKEHEEDMVDRIMKAREMMYSEGGRVANETPIVAGFKDNDFDDLVLRDDLSSSYGSDDNSGDDLGNSREDHDRSDIVARIMKSRAKKDRNPNPA